MQKRRKWKGMAAFVGVLALVAAGAVFAGVSTTNTASGAPGCTDAKVKGQKAELSDEIAEAKEAADAQLDFSGLGKGMHAATPEPVNVVDAVVQKNDDGTLTLAVCDTVAGEVDGSKLTVDEDLLGETGISDSVGERVLLQLDDDGGLIAATDGTEDGAVDDMIEDAPESPEGETTIVDTTTPIEGAEDEEADR